MFTSRFNKNSYFLRGENNSGAKEKKWDERFFLDKIPPYDAYKDVNYLSLGLIKSKIKYENFLEKEKLKKYKLRNNLYSEHLLIDSQQKKQTFNKKLTFSINNSLEKNKTNKEQKTSYSLSNTHNLERKKSSPPKSVGVKKENNYFTNDAENKNGQEKKLTVEESDIMEEFEIIKVMWNKFGVTKKFQENFVNMLNILENNEIIKKFLLLEKKQMQKFKGDLTQLLKKIIHRNDEIDKLKQLISLYKNILIEKKNSKNPKVENAQNLSQRSEQKVIEDINTCLLAVRLHTINVVNQIKNFSMNNAYYFHMNKIDLSKIKNDYYYNEEYVLTIKNDLDFVQNPVMKNLYEFEHWGGGDPFFLSITQKKEEDKNQKNKLKISDKMLSEIDNCLFFLNQAELCLQAKKASIPNKNKIIQYLNRTSNTEERNGTATGNSTGYGLGTNFNIKGKDNLERNIVKLKMQSGYDKLFTFINNSNSSHTPKIENIKNSKKRKDRKIPLMTSQELKDRFIHYEELNSLLNENKNKEDDYKKRDKEIMFQKIKNNMKDNEQKLKQSQKLEEENQYEGELEAEPEAGKEIKIENNNEVKTEENLNKDSKEKEFKEEEVDKSKQKEEKIEEGKKVQKDYEAYWYTDSIEELDPIYNNFISNLSESVKNSMDIPKSSKNFMKGIYPKIIVLKDKNDNDKNKISGICGLNYSYTKNNELFLKKIKIAGADISEGNTFGSAFSQAKPSLPSPKRGK